MQLWSKLSPFWTERSVRNTYRKRMEMHRDFFPHFSVHFAWRTVLWQRTTRTVMVVPQLQSTGGIFAPGALIRTLTLGPRLENGLASKLLEVVFFTLKDCGLVPAGEDRAPGWLGHQAWSQPGCRLMEVNRLLRPYASSTYLLCRTALKLPLQGTDPSENYEAGPKGKETSPSPPYQHEGMTAEK